MPESTAEAQSQPPSGVEPIPLSPYEQQQLAFVSLPEYQVRVLRRTTHKDLGETAYAHFVQEVVRFDDGAVRLATRAAPKATYFGSNGISPYAISGGDALFTGPNGLNEELIDAYAGLGFDVEWLHHQGRHAPWPTSPERLSTLMHFLSTKSVGKSAHHDHAYLDDLESSGVVEFDTSTMIRDGFSRSAMSGEAFIATAPNFRRTVVHSDLTAKCFALYPGLRNLFELGIRQGPEEIRGFGRVVLNIAQRERNGEKGLLKKYAGTFDPHPLNTLHELAWILPLVSGDDGVYSRAIPLDTTGVRGFLTKDAMSQYEEHEIIHTVHPNLVLIVEDGAHVDGAIVENKIERYRRVMEYLREHDMSIVGITHDDYLPPQQDFEIAA